MNGRSETTNNKNKLSQKERKFQKSVFCCWTKLTRPINLFPPTSDKKAMEGAIELRDSQPGTVFAKLHFKWDKLTIGLVLFYKLKQHIEVL